MIYLNARLATGLGKIFLLVSLIAARAMGADLDVYAEKALWTFDLPEGSSMSTYDDSSIIRIRTLFREHQEDVKPFLSISAQRDAVNGALGYERLITRYGGGFRFSRSGVPLKIFLEARHSEEQSSGYTSSRSGDEGVATLAASGQKGSHVQDALVGSWYADVSQVVASNGGSYATGSAWIQISAVSIGSGSIRFVMDPLDVFAYRECWDGCRNWAFAGVGLALNYSVESASIALRANLGERLDGRGGGELRYRDAARLLLVIQGEL